MQRVLLKRIIPVGTKTVHAESSGTADENITWVLSDDGTLTISGNGDTIERTFQGTEAVKVVIQDGVRKIGSRAFENNTSITSVSIPSSV